MYDIEATSTLSDAVKEEIRALLADCALADGGADLEMETSLNFSSEMKCLFLAREKGRLAGLLSVFAPFRREAEISAFVRPGARRRGIFTALLAETERELAAYAIADELFLHTRGSSPLADFGAVMAAHLGARLDFTEYSMRYTGSRSPESAATGLRVVEAGLERFDEMVSIRMEAFGNTREEVESFLRSSFASPNRRHYVALLGDVPVGVLATGLEEGKISINGLAVAPAFQGKGYGRSLVAGILDILVGSGKEIVLEVDSVNDRAFALYKKMGFTVTAATDYCRRQLPSA